MPTSDPVAFEARPGALTEVTVVFREPTIILPYALVGGVVSGDVVDEWGQPAEGVGVQLWRTMFQGGRPMLAPYGAPRTTDDRGQYRLFHIPAGRYVLVAADPSWRADGEPAPWLPVFYPGRASHADAVPLQVGRSQELGGVNMIFARRRGSRVFGVALDGEGRPQTRVTLVSSGVAATVAQRPRTATANPDGSFEFTGLPPGDYMVRARNVPVIAPGAPAFAVAPGAPPEIEAAIRALAGTPAGSNPPIEVAMQPVTLIDADVGPVIMKTAPAATLRGRVVFQGNRRDTPFTISAVTNDPAFAETSGSQVIAQAGVAVPDGTFELRGLAGPIRLVLAPQIASPMLGRELQAGAPSGWWLKSARVGASDAAKEFLTFDGVTDSRDDVEIVVAETAAAVSGAVVDSQGQTVGDGWVVIFSTDREQWFLGSSAVRAINIGSGGRFSVASLPPGGYFIAALDAIEGNELNGEWQYPELLEMLAPVARRVTLSESQRLTIQQRLVLMSRIP
jgi:hypothetical protein